MPLPLRRRGRALHACLTWLVLAVPPLQAQHASAYIPNDDPMLPLLEHLVVRGDVADPSPQVRPFRRSDAVRVLAAADSAAGGDSTSARGRLVHHLLARWRELPGEGMRVEGAARGGLQSYSQGRRELLQPGGGAGTSLYADLAFGLRTGRFVAAARGVVDPRLLKDPDWPGTPPSDSTGLARFPEAYGSLQFEQGSLFLGQIARSWGPVGLPSFQLGDYRYPQGELGFDVGSRTIQFRASFQQLYNGGTEILPIQRYFVAHRLTVRPSPRLALSLWEDVLADGVGRNWDLRFANPFAIITFQNQFGYSDARTNIMFGFDTHWRASRHLLLEAQLALDDLTLGRAKCPTCPVPRWGVSLQGSGALGATLSWRAAYQRASSLLYRTFNAEDDFSERGVGLGVPFTDNERVTLAVGIPVAERTLLAPDLTLLRQGEGNLRAPFPADPATVPTQFIGTIATTYRAGLTVSGTEGPFDLSATGALQYTTNYLNVAGDNRTRLVGRVQATLGWKKAGFVR